MFSNPVWEKKTDDENYTPYNSRPQSKENNRIDSPNITYNKNILLFCGDDSQASNLCTELIKLYHTNPESKVNEMFNVLFLSQHKSIEEFEDYKNMNPEFFYLEYEAIPDTDEYDILYKLEMRAPSILVINKNTLKKKGRDGLNFFDIKDVNMNVEKIEKVEYTKFENKIISEFK